MTSTTTATEPMSGAGRDGRRRWLGLIVVCLAMFMNALDSSIVNVALPAIQRQLDFSPTGLTWVVDAYLITFGSFLLLAGRLGDLVGRKRVFLVGVALFVASSALCGLAPDQGVLVAGRFVQGIGGALSSSVIIAIIVTEFPEAAERATAMSAYIFVAVGGGSIGLLVGGLLTQGISWHWIFFINVPIGIATLVLGAVFVDENEGLGVRDGIDVTGSLLATLALMTGIYAIVTTTSSGWLSAHTIGWGGASLALLVAFVVLESRRANPIMPLRVFRIPTLLRSSVVRGLLNTGMFATFFLGALYFEHVLRYSPVETGLAFLPISLVMAALSLGGTARLVERFGDKRVLVPGMAFATAGLVLLARAGTHADYLTGALPGLVLLGLGAGTSFVPLLGIAMRDVPAEDAGLASGVVNVSMQAAAAVGLAILATVAAARTRTLVGSGDSTPAALAGGYHLAFLVAAGFTAVSLVVAIVWLPGSRTRTAGEDEQLLAAENAGEPLTT